MPPRALLAILLLLGVSACRPAASDREAPPTPAGPTQAAGDRTDARPVRKSFDFQRIPRTTPAEDAPKARAVAPVVFADVAAASGLGHVYDNGASPKALMVESTGGGAGWIDFDRDRRLDLVCVQGGVPDCPAGQLRPPDRLFRGRAAGAFSDCAAAARFDEGGYSQGAACGDFNNDGWEDVYVTSVGPNVLFENQGDGTFRQVTSTAGVSVGGWSTSAAWADVDRDGDLDLYCCTYAKYDPYHPRICRDEKGNPSICHPRHVDPTPDRFFRNLGEGGFDEQSQAAKLFGPGNKALGVAVADFDGDAWPDIYVANDTTANFLMINDGAGRQFKESAYALGCALSHSGEPQASMGVAVNDYDRNGFLDIVLTHFTGESDTLYQNNGPLGFEDVSHITGLRDLTLPKLGFGVVMEDFNADGAMDLFITNGHIDPKNSDGDGYEMRPQLFSFNGRKWVDQSAAAGPFFELRLVGRGAAASDFDFDGDLDLAVVHQNSPMALLRNDSPPGRGFHVRLIGVHGDRNAVGTVVTATVAGEALRHEVIGGGSYASTSERVLAFGWGDEAPGPVSLQISWPTGTQQTVEAPEGVRDVLIVEGRGAWLNEWTGRAVDEVGGRALSGAAP